jgi:hypothetical protein
MGKVIEFNKAVMELWTKKEREARKAEQRRVDNNRALKQAKIDVKEQADVMQSLDNIRASVARINTMMLELRGQQGRVWDDERNTLRQD